MSEPVDYDKNQRKGQECCMIVWKLRVHEYITLIYITL